MIVRYTAIRGTLTKIVPSTIFSFSFARTIILIDWNLKQHEVIAALYLL